jgi:hypothetical protein
MLKLSLALLMCVVIVGCATTGELSQSPDCTLDRCGPETPPAGLVPFIVAPDRLFILTPFGEGTYWFVREPIVWSSHLGRVTVPAGFVTDFASVPRFFWFFFPKWDGYGGPAIVHDFLYYSQHTSRLTADEWILAGMEDMHVGTGRRHTIYTVLRLFGSFAWAGNASRKAKKQYSCIDPAQFHAIEPTTTWEQYRPNAIPCMIAIDRFELR